MVGRRLTIRTKLLLLSLALLSIPYVGYEYLRETERLLRSSLETSLLAAARTHAASLHENPDLFPLRAAGAGADLFVHPLQHEVQLDGYADDWQTYLEWADTYTTRGKLQRGVKRGTPQFGFRLILGTYQHYLYGFVQVYDNDVVYSPSHRLDGDRIDLVFTDLLGTPHVYSFSTAAPGRITPVERLLDQDGEYVTRPVTNIAAVWQTTASGYNLELRVPLHIVGRRFGLLAADVDGRTVPMLHGVAGTSGANTLVAPGLLLRPSLPLQRLISSAGHSEGRRVWVLDGLGQVLASGGDLKRSAEPHPFNTLYALILPPVVENFTDDLEGASRLHGSETEAALQGRAETRWRSSPDGRTAIVSAGHPVWADNAVRGAVVVEETANTIQTLQRKAMANLFNKTLAVFAIVTVLLLAFASHLSVRLRRLSRDANAAIDSHGRVVGEIRETDSADEIGDVSRQLSAMLGRLREYNAYLESMAGKLSHELRTPMAVVRSSLDNLDQLQLDESSSAYLQRAHDGVERLNLLVTRLSEAARLEQALQTAVTESLALRPLIESCVAGYRTAYADTAFELIATQAEFVVDANPDLIVQMLDKLIANAVDFRSAAEPVKLALRQTGSTVSLEVINYGSQLPDAFNVELFNSMISVRSENKGDPHLGLGLYVVRLIAEFHKAAATAENLPGLLPGVCFRVTFKSDDSQPKPKPTLAAPPSP